MILIAIVVLGAIVTVVVTGLKYARDIVEAADERMNASLNDDAREAENQAKEEAERKQEATRAENRAREAENRAREAENRAREAENRAKKEATDRVRAAENLAEDRAREADDCAAKCRLMAHDYTMRGYAFLTEQNLRMAELHEASAKLLRSGALHADQVDAWMISELKR